MRWPSSRTSGSALATMAWIRSARSGASGLRVEVAQVVADVGVDLGAVAAQQRLGEPAEHHAAGQVGHRREAHLRGGDQVLQGEPGGLAQRLQRRRLRPATARSSADDHRDVGRHPLLRQEDPEDRGLQLRRAVQVGDAVVPRAPASAWPGTLSADAGPLDVEALQVGVEVLARAVHRAAPARPRLAGRPVAAQLGQVGEDRQQVDLARQRPAAAARPGAAR